MIEVQHISKGFKLYHRPADRLKELLLRRPFHHRYQALDDVSFTVNKGETLSVIGRNGAGKSTLLKILNGVLIADTGKVICSGPVTGLLELGTGFDSALNGLHNIRTNGLLLGMSASEINERLPQIIAFSELGSFINEPLRTYSSGMTMRLAFAIAIHAQPDTFLIDEALSVGDGHFQQKCMRRIREFRASGGAIVFVSHDLNAVKMISNRVLVLNDGAVVFQGNPEDGVNTYNQLLAGDTDDEPSTSQLEQGVGGYGILKSAITDAQLQGKDSHSSQVTSGEAVFLEVDIVGHEDIPLLTLGMVIRDRFGQDIFGTNSHVLAEDLSLSKDQRTQLRFHFHMQLAPGKYTISLALHEGIDHTKECYHWWDNACQFEVSGIRGSIFVGVCNLAPTLETVF